MVHHNKCCVQNCKNNGKNSDCKFYKFPKLGYKLPQKEKWIAAVRKVNPSDWIPKESDYICSKHFIGGMKSNEVLSPAYIPTIFEKVRKRKVVSQDILTMRRHARFMKKLSQHNKDIENKNTLKQKNDVQNQQDTLTTMDCDVNIYSNQKYLPRYVNQGCQANIFKEERDSQNSFTCNRYVYPSGSCDSEVQTNIYSNSKTIVPNGSFITRILSI